MSGSYFGLRKEGFDRIRKDSEVGVRGEVPVNRAFHDKNEYLLTFFNAVNREYRAQNLDGIVWCRHLIRSCG